MKQISLISILLFLLSLLFGVGCGYKGNGNITVENRTVGSFSKIRIEQQSPGGLVFGEQRLSGFNIKLVQDTLEAVSVEYDDNLIHHVKTEAVNGTLIIKLKRPLYSRRDVNVRVHYRTLSALEGLAFGQVIFANTCSADVLKIDLSGACNMEGPLQVNELMLDVSGASEIRLTGQARKVRADLSGAADYQAFQLQTDTCYLDISGAGDARVFVRSFLQIDASGAADIQYRGNPVLQQDVSGAVDIKPAPADSL